MDVIILQPPLMQLNTAYPSGAYLSDFFKKQGCSVKWIDLNIALFYEIFSRKGLEKLFKLAKDNALSLAEAADKKGDDSTAFNLRRYVSERNLWINWIERITAILRGQGFECAHAFVFGAHVPRGNRMENYLSSLDHTLTTDDARSLASLALADLADFISVAFDSNFSLVRYAESLTISESLFSEIEKGADSPVIKNFYEPVLEKMFLTESAIKPGITFTEYSPAAIKSDSTLSEHSSAVIEPIEITFNPSHINASKTLVLISVPFPGTFAAALATGRFFKNHFRNKVYVSMGGGFINTELRETKEKNLAKYTDALCFDRGYASYKTLLESLVLKKAEPQKDAPASYKQIYKLRQFVSTPSTPDNAVSKSGSIVIEHSNVSIEPGTMPIKPANAVPEPVEMPKNIDYGKLNHLITVIDEAPPAKEDLLYESQTTRTLVPDFSDIDFSIYPRLIDDTNPMHRLWSDGAWIKAYMAHGCYWHKCAFCDVTLDYVKSFCMTDIKNLYEGLYVQCIKKNIYGIHFVDEAMPPSAMVAFAKENIAHGSPISWWGNVRFEKYFTRDVADFLAYGGLIGVSAGLESATGNGLTAIHKGTDLESIVTACCAFKEAGVLVHAYMIYGYWFETPQDLINSMETLRQFYANGLLDSSFWHKFVLTRHSRVYAEWKQGMHPELKVIEDKNIPLFAKNGLHFEGEKSSQKYGKALEYSLEQWMHGRGLEKPVQKWFSFAVPRPTVSTNFIEKLIEKYEQKRDRMFSEIPSTKTSSEFWLGGEKIELPNGKVLWFYMGELYEENKNADISKLRGKGLCSL